MTIFQRAILLGAVTFISSMTIWASSEQQTININQASSKKLAKIQGIGQKKANAIVDYRQQHGRFQSVQALRNVQGIGPNMAHKLSNNEHVSLGPKQNQKQQSHNPKHNGKHSS